MTADLTTPDPKWLTDLRQDMRSRILKLRAASAPTDALIEAASSLAEARMRPLQNRVAELERDLAALNSGRRYLPLSEVTAGHVRAYRRAYEDTMRGGPGVTHDECVRAGLAAIQWPAEAAEPSPEMREVPLSEAAAGDLVTLAGVVKQRNGYHSFAVLLDAGQVVHLNHNDNACRGVTVTRPVTPLPDIRDEAVDAAAKLLGYGSTEGEFREHVRRVLTAAAPFMVGQDPS